MFSEESSKCWGEESQASCHGSPIFLLFTFGLALGLVGLNCAEEQGHGQDEQEGDLSGLWWHGTNLQSFVLNGQNVEKTNFSYLVGPSKVEEKLVENLWFCGKYTHLTGAFYDTC